MAIKVHANSGAKPVEFKKISLKIRTILTILASENELFDLVAPFIDILSEKVDWDLIFSTSLSESQKCTAHWAYIVWLNELPEALKPAQAILSLDLHFRRAIVSALSPKWCTSK